MARPRIILALGFILFAVSLIAAGSPANLKAGGFDDTGSESATAARYLETHFPRSQPNLVVLVTDPAGADSADAKEAGAKVLDGLRATHGVSVITSYYEQPVPDLQSKDRTAGLTIARVMGDEDTRSDTAEKVYDTIAGSTGSAKVTVGGITHINNETTKLVDRDVIIAEGIALPMTLILLIFVFRCVVAALLPTLTAGLSIIGSLGALTVLSRLTDVSIFAVQLITTLGLGLAVDYSLLIVGRYREERRRGVDNRTALKTTMSTAGRTVVFSAIVLACTLASLLVFPLYFLRSSAYAGLIVLAFTLIGALVLLPAAMLLLGDRIDAWSLRRSRKSAPASAEQHGWARFAGRTMRRPMLYAVPVVAVLTTMLLPLTSMELGVPDQRMLPSSAESRIVQDTLQSQFGQTGVGSVTVVAPQWDAGSGEQLAGYAARLSGLPHVDSVDSAAGRFAGGQKVSAPDQDAISQATFAADDATWLQVNTSVTSYSQEGRDLATAVRDTAVPGSQQVYVGGAPAELTDTVSAITERLPIALGLIVVFTVGFLFLLTGSVLLPLKALLFNVISLGSIFGLMVWIFQQGNLADLLAVTPAPIPVAIPVLFFCVAFGLSMDYEVFILSRIKERYDATGEVFRSVREGLGATGPIVTMAAAILAVSFFSMAFSVVTPIKLFGLSTGLAILLDAFVIRGILVPVFFRLAGKASWWAPRGLRRVHKRFELSEA